MILIIMLLLDVNFVKSSLMTFSKLIAYEYFDYVGGHSLGFG